MVKSIRFSVLKAYKSWLLVDGKNRCVFLFDEPPEEWRTSRLKLHRYAERCIINDLNGDYLARHNLLFFSLDNYNKLRAIKAVAKAMNKYYNQ